MTIKRVGPKDPCRFVTPRVRDWRHRGLGHTTLPERCPSAWCARQESSESPSKSIRRRAEPRNQRRRITGAALCCHPVMFCLRMPPRCIGRAKADYTRDKAGYRFRHGAARAARAQARGAPACDGSSLSVGMRFRAMRAKRTSSLSCRANFAESLMHIL